MFRKIISFLLLLLVAFSCKKTDPNPDFSAIDKLIIEDYISVKKLTAQSTSSGLYYVITAPGESVHPTINSSVTAYYKGYLADGTVFDQTVAGKPATFPLANVIDGWQEGLQLIPSALGYGGVTKPGIPKNSVLIFDVELVSFTN